MAKNTHNGVGQRMTLSKTWERKTCKSCAKPCEAFKPKNKACKDWVG